MIRPATPDDATVVAALLAELDYPSDVDAVRKRLGETDRVLLAEPDAGLVALHRIPRLAEGGCFARITALVVSPSYRGRGVARALLAAAEQQAREWGAAMLEVTSGRRPERDAAHALYLTAGYEDVAGVSVHYRKAL